MLSTEFESGASVPPADSDWAQFRDMTSERFGAGHERSASSDNGCFAVLVLVATLATILFWLIGTAAEVRGPHERLQPGSRIRRAYSSQFLARLLV